MIVVYITCKDKEEAVKVSRVLLENKLVVCTNFFPINSMYWWKGKIEEDNEFVVVAKTKEENYEKIKCMVKEVHSYDTPCVISWKVDNLNKEYKDWMDSVLK